jgi:hypothetical protein
MDLQEYNDLMIAKREASKAQAFLVLASTAPRHPIDEIKIVDIDDFL